VLNASIRRATPLTVLFIMLSGFFICRSINRDTKSQLGKIRLTTDALVMTYNAMTVKKLVPWARFDVLYIVNRQYPILNT
jgi:hypothetical protein